VPKNEPTWNLPDGLFDRLVSLRRDIHRHPELSFEEHRTSARVASELQDIGLSPIRDVAGTGVIADIEGKEGGPTVVLRADLDALPIEEDTGLPYASEVPGVMHACAHDGHTATVLGAGALLLRDPPQGKVRLLFQPAEERGNGAKVVCDEGHLDGVDAIFGIHVDPFQPTGIIQVQEGPVAASTRSFRITLTGKGGHAARPHQGVDAVVAGARLVDALQGIVAREISPAQPAVVTVGRFSAGTRHNVLAGKAEMEGTIRCFDREVEASIREAIVRIAEAVSRAHRATAEVGFGEGCPAVINDRRMTHIASQAAATVVGSDRVIGFNEPNMGGEDFSFYLDHAPGCYVRLGAGVTDTNIVPAHSARFVWDERTMAVGARYLEAVARAAITELR